jgi:hypothetical protein
MPSLPGLELPLGRARLLAAGGTPTPTPPAALLIGSRFNQMGFAGFVGSDGVDTDSNTRIASWNETGATVTKLRAIFANWMANATNEQDGYNAITVTASIEYPAGTFTPLLFSGAASASLPASGGGSLVESDELTLPTPIPASTQFWVRSHVAVSAGQKWVQGYLLAISGLGEAADFSSGVDKTMGGTITNATPGANRRGYGPVAVKATAFAETPVARAFVGVGDSRVMGSTDVLDPAATGHGNSGYFAKACAGRYPVLNLGIAGTQAQNNLPANFVRRAALMARAGITHVFGNWSINDINAGRTGAQLSDNIATIAVGFKSAVPGVKVIWATMAPYTTSTDNWITAANQAVKVAPAGAFTGGASSQRSLFNAALRAGISGVDSVFEEADTVEVNSSNALTRDGGLWISGNGGTGATSTHLTTTAASTDKASTDGLHPSVTNTGAPGYGGVYILRDAVRAVFDGW